VQRIRGEAFFLYFQFFHQPVFLQLSVPAASIYQYNKHWSPEAIIPLSANIQWIVYSNGADYLVKVLLNEKEAVLPVQTKHAPYYEWAEVKKYYLDKLNALK